MRSITPDLVGAASVFRGLISSIRPIFCWLLLKLNARALTSGQSDRWSIRRQFDCVLYRSQVSISTTGRRSATHRHVSQASAAVCAFIDLIIRTRPHVRACLMTSLSSIYFLSYLLNFNTYGALYGTLSRASAINRINFCSRINYKGFSISAMVLVINTGRKSITIVRRIYFSLWKI